MGKRVMAPRYNRIRQEPVYLRDYRVQRTISRNLPAFNRMVDQIYQHELARGPLRCSQRDSIIAGYTYPVGININQMDVMRPLVDDRLDYLYQMYG